MFNRLTPFTQQMIDFMCARSSLNAKPNAPSLYDSIDAKIGFYSSPK